MKKIFKPLFLVAVLLSVFSCMKDKEVDEMKQTTSKNAQVKLRLKTPSGYSKAETRSLSYTDENTINNIYVLVFDKTNTLVTIEQGTNVSSTPGSSNPSYSGEGAFTITLAASKTMVDTYNLVVLANAQSILSATIGLDIANINNKSYSDVMTKIWDQISGPMYSTGGAIPMWGESGQLVVAAGNSSQTLQLTRSVARIDVGVGKPTKDTNTDAWTWDGKDVNNANIPFVLKHVYVIKPNNRYAVVADASALLAGEPTVPTGTTAFTMTDSENNFEFAATVNATGGYTSRDIYVPEADIEMGTSAQIGDANHANRMALVVGGEYNGGTETFYRIDFAVNGNLVNVLRNHLYQFNISKVSGEGFPDVETAYNSLSMNMAVNIREWDEGDITNIVFDGQYYLGVSQSEFELTRKAGNYDLIITTDHPNGWDLTIKDENKVDMDPTTGWLKKVSINPGMDGKDTYTFSVEALSVGSPNRVAYLYVTAGRLTNVVKVVQTDQLPFMLQLTPSDILEFESGLALDPATPIDPQTVNVFWEPMENSANYKVRAIGSNGGLTFLQPTGDLTVDNPITGGDVNLMFQPEKFTETEVDPNLGRDPFLEKISRLEVTATNDVGESITKTLTFKQKNYAALITKDDFYILEGGEGIVTVKANTPWRAELILGGDAIDKITIGQGQGEITIGEELKFKLLQGDDTHFEGNSQIRIYSPTGRFKDVIVDIKAYRLIWVGNLGYLPGMVDEGSTVYMNAPHNTAPHLAQDICKAKGYILPTRAIIDAWLASSIPFPTTGAYWVDEHGWRGNQSVQPNGGVWEKNFYYYATAVVNGSISYTHTYTFYHKHGPWSGTSSYIKFTATTNGYQKMSAYTNWTTASSYIYAITSYNTRCVKHIATK
ncbi:fimbrial protein [Bacteroides sp. 224]|uniref:fimbrial protein n=1 Tax=Bacteroides sp. 224 TaxID=2302936 RepID=UPI0013D69F60|nr:fimbrial protein [Bacteroides sp. 224]NDV67013.1 hypothetical protein [Bacteroides sp. 224]